MKLQSKLIDIVKDGFHQRNPHRVQYDFALLTQKCKELIPFVFVNKYGNSTIDFANSDAVKNLNKALLIHFYDIQFWDIPDNYLCPPIPGRADYIHNIADLLAQYNNGQIPFGESITMLDIGLGANCIYPIIARKEYGWRVVGTEVDQLALSSAQKIISENELLNQHAELRLQMNKTNIFVGAVNATDYFDIVVCNPPFYSSAQEALNSTTRKLRNLSANMRQKKKIEPIRNFGGQNSELWCNGGEEAFICRMVAESVQFSKQCKWFSTLVSQKTTLPSVYRTLKNYSATNVKTIEMAHGQKKSRIVAWSFMIV